MALWDNVQRNLSNNCYNGDLHLKKYFTKGFVLLIFWQKMQKLWLCLQPLQSFKQDYCGGRKKRSS